MKKRSVSGNETSPTIRRKTRASTSSKQTHHVEHEKEKILHKRHKVRLADIQESPTKKSPEINSKNRQDTLKSDARFETPKSKKSSYLLDSTPFKDDLLLASQGYDAQCDVRWDCTSPDALRYIRKNRQRHHSSDVAGIVQLLIPGESREEDAAPSTNTPPLLGLWMNSSNRPTHASKEDKSSDRALAAHSSKLVRFRKKEKSRSNTGRDAKIPSEWLEKLKLAVERCDEDSTISTEETEIDKCTKKDASSGLDQSKDLFADADATASGVKRGNTSPGCQNARVVDSEDGDHNSDLNWSDDEMFQDDSLLMKATQDPVIETKGTLSDKRGNKRKSRETEESQCKISKVCLDSRQELHRNPIDNRKQRAGVIPYKMLQGSKGKSPSPFRKVKSFNDIDLMQTKHAHDLSHNKSRKCLSLRNSDNVTKTQSVPNVSTSNLMSRITITQGKSVSCNQASKPTNILATDKKQYPVQGDPQVDTRTSVDSSSGLKVMKHVSSTTTRRFHVTGGSNSSSTTNRVSTLQSGLGDACCSGPNKVSGKGNSAPVYTTSQNLKCQVNISSRTYIFAKSQNTNSCVVNNHENTGVSNQNSAVRKSESNKSSGLQCTDSAVTITSTTSTCRRRSSGMFDTSLSDDLLCQLAEPDELLDSQASPTPKNSGHNKKSLSIGTLPHQGKVLQGAPLQGVCVAKSCDSPKSSTLLTKDCDRLKSDALLPKCSKDCMTIESKTVPQSSNVIGTGGANQKSSHLKQSGVSCGSKPIFVQSSANTVISSSQVSSTQRSKFKFKSKSANSGMVVTSASTFTSKMSPDQPRSTSPHMTNKVTAVASKSSGPSPVDNSEDLFTSDEDELSEQQILAMLDTVEMEASQMPPVPQSQQCQKTSPSAFTSKCSINEIEQKKDAAKAKLQKKNVTAVSPESMLVNESSIKLSPTKYMQEEIERKKQAALEKRRIKSKETLSESSSVTKKYKQDRVIRKPQNIVAESASAVQVNSTASPVKYQQDDIERKRQAAVERLKLREEKNKCVTGGVSSDRNSVSPGKCTPDEIERKKLAALERKKHLSGEVTKPRHQSDSSPGFSSSQSAESSPFKCTPEEIEKKKLAALAKLKIKKNLCSQLSGKGN